MNKLVKIIWLIIISALVAVNIYNIYFNIKIISYPYELAVGEAFVLNASRLVSEGRPIYYSDPTNNFDKFTAVYPPIYYFVSSLFYREPSYLPGRIISFISVILSVLLIFLILRRFARNNFLSISISLVFPLLSPIMHYGGHMRVDSLGLFLLLLSLFLISTGNKYLFYLSPIILVASFFTKFNYAIIVIPIFIIFLATRKIKWFIYLLEFGFCAGLIFLLINWISTGAFIENTLSYVGTASYSFIRGLQFVKIIVISYFFIFAAILHKIMNFKFKTMSDFEKIIVLYFLILLPYSVFAIGKGGTDINQFFELSAASLLVFGLSFGDFGDNEVNLKKLFIFILSFMTLWIVFYTFGGDFQKIVLFVILTITFLFSQAILKINFKLGLIILAVFQVCFLYFRPGVISASSADPSRIIKDFYFKEKDLDKVREILTKKDGPALSWCNDCLLFSGKEGLIEPFVINNLANAGIFKTDILLENINTKKYSTIIMPQRFGELIRKGSIRTLYDDEFIFTRMEVVNEVDANYMIDTKVGDVYILYPK